MKRAFITFFAIVFFGIGLNAQDLGEVGRSASNEHEHFGWSMAMDENWLIVGSPHSETAAGLDAGKVVIYQKNGDGWDEFQVLVDAEGNTFQNYGFSIDMHSSVLVVGSIGTFQNGPFTGRAYVYEFNGTNWELTNSLEAPDGSGGQYFGHSVATNGNRIIVGAIKADGAEPMSGAVYDFEKADGLWGYRGKLIATDGVTNDNFGFAVDINDEDKVVVGAPNQTDIIDKSGAAYIFEFDGSEHQQTAKLKAFNRTRKDFLGSSVAINRDDVVAGAFLADGFSNNTGSVYYFTQDGDRWIEAQQVAYEGSQLNDYYGKAVAMSDFRLFIGAPKANAGTSNDVGRGYYYEKEGGIWVLKQIFEDPDGSRHNFFGSSVAVSDFGLGISARLYDGRAQDGGAVYTAGLGEVTSLEEEIPLDKAIELINYPNPTQNQVTIRYKLLKASRVAVEVFDGNGLSIKELLPETIQQPGNQELEWNLSAWDGSRVANGIYFYKLAIDGNVVTRKIIVTR